LKSLNLFKTNKELKEMTSNNMGAFEKQLIDIVLDLSINHISALALDRAKIGIIDTIGIGISGSCEPLSQIVRGLTSGTGVSIWGTTFQAGLADAIWANSIAAHVLDWDDYSHPMYGHCSSVLTPVCLAFGQAYKRSGRELIEAWLVGHEINARIGNAATVQHYRKGWHATSTVGVFGATASAARLLKLDARQIAMALGIAASSASGIRENFGTMTKPLHTGQAARAGAMSALLAMAGVEGSEKAISGKYGFLSLYGEGLQIQEKNYSFSSDLSYLAIEGQWGLVLKPYACCGSSHPLIDATLEIMDQTNPSSDLIRSIICHIDPFTSTILQFHNPQSPFEARYSLEYAVAVAILDRAVVAQQFEAVRVLATDVQNMMKRIKLIEDLSNPEDSIFGGQVVIEFNNGQIISKQIDHGLGHPLNQMNLVQRQTKFRSATSSLLVNDDATYLIDALERIEQFESVDDLMKLMIPTSLKQY